MIAAATPQRVVEALGEKGIGGVDGRESER